MERTFLFAGANEQDAKAWLKDVVPLLKKSNLESKGCEEIGRMLASAPDDPEDGIWPVKYVREFIEESDERLLGMLERGLKIGKFNSIGIRLIDPKDPGRLYSSRAAKFSSDAEKIRIQYPKTAGVLDRIAEHYEEHARHVRTMSKKNMI